MISTDFCFTFPSIRGIQAGREYYVTMCPLKLIPKLFHFDDEALLPEMRAQRVLNKARIPEIARYITDNKENYTFSAITASIDGEVSFEPIDKNSKDINQLRLGSLHVPMDSTFVVNDGQHRRAAIEMAIEKEPSLGNETISVVFFIDRGLKRSQQMFSDLNRHAVRPSASLGVLYDHRDIAGGVTKFVALRHELFSRWIEFERSTLSQRSKKLFTLSALHFATRDFLTESEYVKPEAAQAKALAFWEEVAKNMKEWQMVAAGEMTAGELRTNFVHGHAVLLQAIARMGRDLLDEHPRDWRRYLKKLQTIDWSKKNTIDWEGRAMTGGRMCKTTSHIALTANQLKKKLGLELTEADLSFEKVKK